MRKLAVLVILVPVLFGLYWIAGARTLEGSLSGWIGQRAAEGWVAEYREISTSGFPTRFETRLADLMLADPSTGVAWAAPRFTVVAQSRKPNRITAIWPRTQTLASPYQTIEIGSDRMDASIEFVPGTRLELRSAELDLVALRLSSSLGWSSALDRGHLSARATGRSPNSYRVEFDASEVTPSGRVRAILDPARVLPDVIEGLKIEAGIAFDAPLDRFAIEDARPQITSIDISDLRASWGDLELRAAGTLDVDENGVPEGRIEIKARNWREMIRMAQNAGAIPDGLAPTVERAFELLAGMSGKPDTLDAPLTFRKGRMLFGPIPLGPAPNFTIR